MKKGESGNPAGRPKGARNYKTLFKETYKHIAGDLKLGKEPDTLMVKLFERGIIEALKGNYSFYKDIMDRMFGKPKERIEEENKEKLLVVDKENERE